MMLPIMIGLQMAISVSQLEQGDLSLSDLGYIKERWAAKEQELQEHLLKMPAMPADPDAICPPAPAGFDQAEGAFPVCRYTEVKSVAGQISVARIYWSNKGWSACFVSEENPDPKCADEV